MVISRIWERFSDQDLSFITIIERGALPEDYVVEPKKAKEECQRIHFGKEEE